MDVKTGGNVRLTVAENFVSGFIEAGEEIYYIIPARNIDRSASENLFLLYNNRDASPEKEAICGVTKDAEDAIRKSRENFRGDEGDRTTENCRIVDYAIACDYSMFEKYGSVTNLVNRNLAVMNNVQVNYIDQFADNFIFEIKEQFLVTEPGGDPWTSSTNPSTLLNSFTAWGPTGFTAVHDVAALWSDRDFDGSTVGLAWVGVICSPSRYSVNEDFTTNEQSIRVLLAHETGHNFAAQHDNQGDPFIMAPSVNPSAVDFSAASRTAVNNHMNSPATACVTPCPADTDPVCGGRFYDSGGADEKYGNNEVITTVICPDEDGDVVTVLFNFFKTQPGVDFLSCYNGNNINAPQIWTHSGLNLPTTNPVVGENPTGCLTFQFVSNGSIVNDGWAATISCQEGGPCPAPIDLGFTSVDGETVELFWTDIGFGVNYDIAYGEEGFTFIGIPDIVGTTDNPYLLSGLETGVEYEFYVRANCGEDISNWAGPFLFSTYPVNNSCAGAISVPVNNLGDCPGMAITSSTLGTSQTGPDVVACNSGNGNYTDIWYSFNTGNNSTLNFDVDAIGATNLGMQLFIGNCTSLGYTNCNVTNFIANLSGFPLNTTIYVRFFTDITQGEQGDFTFCISSIVPVVTNNTCATAFELESAATCIEIGGTTNGATNSIPKVACEGFTANSATGDVWYSFEADGLSDYTITLDMTVDAVLVLYTNTCGALTFVDCADSNLGAGVEEIETGVLVTGTYYIRVYGYSLNGNFDICVVSSQDYNISEITPDQCIGFTEIESPGEESVWTNIVDGSDNIIAALDLNGVDPGIDFVPTLYISSEIREDGLGVKYMNRDISIESSAMSFDQPVPLRLFYSQADLLSLIAEDPSVNSIGDVNITKSAIDCQGDFSGPGEFFAQTNSGAIGDGYFVEIEVTSFSTFYAHGGSMALPVTLLSFTGEALATGNALHWRVTDEVNLEKYEVERSADGKVFELVQTKAATTASNNYDILDSNAPETAYYRLRMVDWTEEFAYSPIIRISRNEIVNIQIRPNPVRDNLQVIGNTDEVLDYQILDISGRQMKLGRTSAGASIEVGDLRAGMYILSINFVDKAEIIKFIKI